MQKILEILKRSLLAKLCLQIFILNFFCMQTFGMIAVYGPPRSYGEDKRVYICNKPEVDISFDFIEDDFRLSYISEGQQESLSKKDGIFDGERYVFNFGENVCLSVDEIERKIFCHKLLASSSISFSVGAGSLMLYEILCGSFMNLKADNIGILGLVSASQGLVFNVLSSLENLGTIDSLEVSITSKRTKNFGKVIGKNVTVNSTDIELNENSVIGASENLDLKSKEMTADKASIAAKQTAIDAEKFELSSSVLNVTDKLIFQGAAFRLKDQSAVKVGSEVQINAKGFTNYESRFEAGDLKFSVGTFLNAGGEIFSWKDAYIKGQKNIKNTSGKIEARRNLGLSGEKLVNAGDSLIEGGFVKINADNAINLESIIRSLMGDIGANLKIVDGEFVSNKYALSNAKNTLLKIPEDEFKGKRYFKRQSKYPNSEKNESNDSDQDQFKKNSNKEKGKGKEESEDQENDQTTEDQKKEDGEDKQKEEAKADDNKEIGSFLNYSGEIISAAKLRINGSGSLYNVVDSIIESQEDMRLSFFGNIHTKSRSEIKSQKDIDMLAKIGIIYFENGKLEALNSKLESSDFCVDEFSEISERGKLTSISKKFVNKGNIDVEDDIDLRYGQFDNSGDILSKKNIEIRELTDFDSGARSFTNQNGEINSKNKLTIESINVPFKGKLRTKEYEYKLIDSNTKGLIYFIDNNVECDRATYDYGVGVLKVNKDIVLKNPTTFLSGGFYNKAVITALSKLKIKSQIFQNGYEHNEKDKIKNFNGYNLKESECDFRKTNKVLVDSDDIIYIRQNKLISKAAILGEDELEFEAENYLYNSGTIESKKKIILNGRKIQTGWAVWEERNLQLPFVKGIQQKYNVHDGVFDFPYDFYMPQKSIIRSYGDMEINCDKFISSFGNVKVDKRLDTNISGLFLNYAGNLMLGKDSHIIAKEFINTIGSIATNEKNGRYWKIATATTDPAALLCDGELKIDVDSYFKNKASYLSAVGNIYLNGTQADDLNGFDSRFVNESMGTEYSRMYTISGKDNSKTTKRYIGIKCYSNETTTCWWQDINETVKDKVLRGAISGAQKIVMQGFDRATNVGVIDAQSIEAINIGDQGFSHGNNERLRFSAQQSEDRKVTVEGAINGSDLFSDYLFENPVTDEIQIPFAIIDDGKISEEDLVKAKPAMTIPEYARMMYRELLKNYSTARLSDMPTFEAGARLAENNTQGQETAINLPHFSKAATKMFTIKPEDVKTGVYFRPYRYTDKYCGQITLFPEMYLSDVSLHSVLRDPYGAMHSEEDISVDTRGNFDATASMASGGRTEIKAKNVNFETKTYDRHTVTYQHFESATGGSVLGTKGGSFKSSKTTGTKTKWERLITAREPVIISTGKGLGICLQEGETAEFKGVIGNLVGGYEVEKGNVKLTPLMVDEVSVSENGSYVIPEYLKTVLEVDGDMDLDIDVFENTGSEIRSTGKMRIKAKDINQLVCEQRYMSNESYKASQTWSLSRNRHEKCYSTKFSIPTMTAEEIEIETTKNINLEGLVTTEKDLKLITGGDISLTSKMFYQYVDYSERLTGPLVDSEITRELYNPQIAPCIVRTGGDYIVEVLGNYYQTGVHSKILKNKMVHAKNIISEPLRVRQTDSIDGVSMENITIGLPSNITQPSFELQISDKGNSLLNQHPLFQAFSDLFGSNSSARKASALVKAGVETYSLVRSVADILASSNKDLKKSAGKLISKLLGLGDFSFTGTNIEQQISLEYGIPSIDIVEDALIYKAEEVGNFTGHQAEAKNITLKAKKELNLYVDLEEMKSINEISKSGVGFNACEFALYGEGSDSNNEAESVKYHTSSFTAKENNTFESPKIYAENPLWEAKRNQVIGQADFVTKYNYSLEEAHAFNLGLSFSFAKGSPSFMVNFGFSGSDNYRESPTLSGIYGDLEITGSVKNDSVPVFGNVQGDYSYSLREMQNHRDGFKVSGSLNLSSLDKLEKSAKNFAQSALAGYLAGKAAQKLGAGNGVASLIGSLASVWGGDIDEGLTSVGQISEVHNDEELEIELVGFNKEQFNEELSQIKRTVFGKAIEEGATTEEAEQISEDEIEAIEKDLTIFLEKAKKVKKLVEKTRKSEAKGKNVVEENTKSEIDDISIDLLLKPSLDEASTSDAPFSKLVFEVLQETSNLTPREQVLVFVPKNEKERLLKEQTLLRYAVEDFFEKHPMAESVFIGATYLLQGAEYVGAAMTGGPFGFAGKYASQEAISHVIDTMIEGTTSKVVEGMEVSQVLRKEFQTTLNVGACIGLCVGSVKAGKEATRILTRSTKNRVSQRTLINNAENREVSKRRGTKGYKLGDFWENKLYSSASEIKGMSPKKQNKLDGILREAKRKLGGEIKMDEKGRLYKFDDGHKSGKIHLERIEKKAEGFRGTGEVDPQTGEVLKIFRRSYKK